MSFSRSPNDTPVALPADLPMQQHPRYGTASRAMGARARRLSLGPMGHVQIIERRWPLVGTFALVSRGPVWRHDLSGEQRREGLYRLIEDLAKQHRGVIVTPDLCDGYDPLRASGLLQTLTPFHAATLDLTGSPEQRRAAQHGKWRNRLNKAEQAGLSVSHCAMPAMRDHWLLKTETLQSRAKGYANLPASFTVAWAATGSDATRLFLAQKDGELIAAMLFLLHEPTASYHIGWSNDLGRACGAHNLLLWKAGNWLADAGITMVDLGALDTIGAPGLARFKLGSGAKVRSTGSTWMRAPLSRTVAKLFPLKG